VHFFRSPRFYVCMSMGELGQTKIKSFSADQKYGIRRTVSSILGEEEKRCNISDPVRPARAHKLGSRFLGSPHFLVYRPIPNLWTDASDKIETVFMRGKNKRSELASCQHFYLAHRSAKSVLWACLSPWNKSAKYSERCPFTCV